MQGLSHGVVRVDTENSLTSLTLQDCGQVLPGGKIQFRCRLRPRNYGVHTYLFDSKDEKKNANADAKCKQGFSSRASGCHLMITR